MDNARKVMTFCRHCHMKCRLFVTVKDNRIESIKNAMGIPGIKAIHSTRLVDHPERVIYTNETAGREGAHQSRGLPCRIRKELKCVPYEEKI
ncbi:MAG: hypothetical protein JRJ03_09560 [Deltaproteobacteria bacterium]|nr:hypothetical protein [Deltaproteobacteria bacterium]